MNIRLALTPLLMAAVAAACSAPPTSGTVSQADARAASAQASPASPGATSSSPQVSEADGVTVTAAWAGPAAGAVFTIAMDTHSGSLDGVSLAPAALRNDRGQQVTGASWNAPPGGHHRKGQLAFGGDSVTLVTGARWIEVLLPDVGGTPERVLRFDVGA